jgi:cell division protein FtsB
MPAGQLMSISITENYLQDAKQQVSQRDINDSLRKAIAELTREVKRLDDDVRRARRELGRRF